ncbi:hypothetical protein [Rudaeicoccus suwonensis]|nr:hypothetical protein [Rudaeicoccus suwonensis]
MRFAAQMNAVELELSIAGAVVLAPTAIAPAEEGTTAVVLTADERAALGKLHRRKIDLADRVLVVNPGGYVGESVRAEITYARQVGKPVAFIDADSVPTGS